jgi:YHS domain-containing protein
MAAGFAAVKEVNMEGLLWFLVLGGLFYFMMRFGCGAHMIHGHSGHGEHAHLGGEESEPIDPVCGMTVEPGTGYGKMYFGTLYNFCSRDCLDKFKADPKKYLKKASGAGGTS